VLEKQRCHFVYYIGSTSESALKEDAGNDESILDALDPEVGELSPMNSEEYEASMKEYDKDSRLLINHPPPNKCSRP
jgi:hypothetical protein